MVNMLYTIKKLRFEACGHSIEDENIQSYYADTALGGIEINYGWINDHVTGHSYNGWRISFRFDGWSSNTKYTKSLRAAKKIAWEYYCERLMVGLKRHTIKSKN